MRWTGLFQVLIILRGYGGYNTMISRLCSSSVRRCLPICGTATATATGITAAVAAMGNQLGTYCRKDNGHDVLHPHYINQLTIAL